MDCATLKHVRTSGNDDKDIQLLILKVVDEIRVTQVQSIWKKPVITEPMTMSDIPKELMDRIKDHLTNRNYHRLHVNLQLLKTRAGEKLHFYSDCQHVRNTEKEGWRYHEVCQTCDKKRLKQHNDAYIHFEIIKENVNVKGSSEE